MSKTTILKPLELKEDLHFIKKYLQQQATNFFKKLKDFKTNEHITFFKNLHLDEETDILSSRSKLMKPNIFLKRTPSILKPMHLTYMLFFYGLQI
jgi:hypothetical protein